MRYICLLIVLFSGITGFSQSPSSLKASEVKNVPVDTLNTDNEVNTVDNELIIVDADTNDGISLISPEQAEQIQSKIIEVPVFNLQDNPDLAALDTKWMDLVKYYDQFDASSMYVENLPSENIAVKELTTEVLKKRLAALNAKTPFNVTYNPELERLIKSYINTRSKTISNLLAKAKYYFPIFEEKFDLYDVPLEMKYLAIVESALQPKAKSRVGATGIWQFMYGTGKQYGLDVTSYIDERQDPILASEAAARHLSDLYDIFEDWDLALAAYNSGVGNVNKAIRRAGGKKNYWNIRPFLPRETANYVPIFYATLYMCEYGEAHNIFPNKDFTLQNYQVDSIQVKRTITFDQIKTTTGIDISLLEFLNPMYKLDIIPYEEGKNYHLILPKEFVGLFVQNEDLIYTYVDAEEAKREKPLPENLTVTNDSKMITYRVKSGDYLGRIAEKYKVSVKNIMKWNHMSNSNIHIGQKLKIYTSGGPSSTTQTKSEGTGTSAKEYITYTVKSGDTLLKIAKKYPNVSVDEIKKWNQLKSDKISVGAKLKIYKS